MCNRREEIMEKSKDTKITKIIKFIKSIEIMAEEVTN